MKYAKVCESCGISYQTKNKTGRFCSTKCVAIHREANRPADSPKRGGPLKHLPKPCEVCGELFKPRRSDARFCGHDCSAIGKEKIKRIATAERPCEKCGKVYLPNHGKQKFCSKACSGAALQPHLSDTERFCVVEGCEKFRVRTDPPYCTTHYYRYTHYGDPLAKPQRRPRDEKAVNLTVNWRELDENSYWKENPTHCPQGHEYTEENGYMRKTRDGKTRRVCRACVREKNLRLVSGEKPDRTARCLTCGLVWEAGMFGPLPRFCKDCALQRQRAKSRSNINKKRGQTPKGPTYVCFACGIVSETPATTGMPPKFCDSCISTNLLESKRKLWVTKNLNKYSLTAEMYEQMVIAQNSTCAVCGTSDPGGAIRRWHIDHDHSCCGPGVSCGKCVRGLLCSRCNTAIGLLEDSATRLEAALSYLKDPPAQRVRQTDT